MRKIVIIGWYGTETIGDRAILAGLFDLLRESSAAGGFEVALGSMYPFFTRRTLSEDLPFLRLCAGNPQLDVTLFDVQQPQELDAAIRRCDALVMGGGPLMGFPSLFMVEYAFARARRLGKRTLVLGCGVGPMRRRIYEQSLLGIIRRADATVLRDETSRLEYERIAGSAATRCASAIDPAVFAALRYVAANPTPGKEDLAVACLRDFPEEYKMRRQIDAQAINRAVADAVRRLCAGRKTLLLPMHCFGVGDDDRCFLNRLCREAANPAMAVQNDPLTLCQTMEQLRRARLCIGMRFHSVVLQTVLNGRNLVLDYTDPATGKIGSFLRQLGLEDRYRRRYFALQGGVVPDLLLPGELEEDPVEVSTAALTRYRAVYLDALNTLT
jgi:polysaccharide pyruvyl transferase WcaK-like protein